MKDYDASYLLQVFIEHLPKEFDELSRLLNSRNSRDASKTFGCPNPHKH